MILPTVIAKPIVCISRICKFLKIYPACFPTCVCSDYPFCCYLHLCFLAFPFGSSILPLKHIFIQLIQCHKLHKYLSQNVSILPRETEASRLPFSSFYCCIAHAMACPPSSNNSPLMAMRFRRHSMYP